MEKNKRKIFNCEQCDKDYNTKTDLKSHYETIHLKMSTRNMCPTCNKVLSSHGRLKVHMRSKHGGVKEFDCDKCEKKFSLRASLKQHVRLVHEKRANHCCPICEKTFVFKGHLNRHITGSHKDPKTGQLAQVIDLPKNPRSPKKIAGKRKEIECDQCNTIFTTRMILKRHIEAVHLKLQFFTCAICQLKFHQVVNLKTHLINVHPSIDSKDNFQCTACSANFSDTRSITAHVRLLHRRKINFASADFKSTSPKKTRDQYYKNVFAVTDGTICWRKILIHDCRHLVSLQLQMSKHLTYHLKLSSDYLIKLLNN